LQEQTYNGTWWNDYGRNRTIFRSQLWKPVLQIAATFYETTKSTIANVTDFKIKRLF
jgi:hypothetical protein